MIETEVNYYALRLLKGNYFPFYEKRFGNWLDNNGDYHIIKALLPIACDISEKSRNQYWRECRTHNKSTIRKI